MPLAVKEREVFISNIVTALQPHFRAINDRLNPLEQNIDSIRKDLDKLQEAQDRMQKDIDKIHETQDALMAYTQRNFDKILNSEAHWKPLRSDFNSLEKRQLLMEERFGRYERQVMYKDRPEK